VIALIAAFVASMRLICAMRISTGESFFAENSLSCSCAGISDSATEGWSVRDCNLAARLLAGRYVVRQCDGARALASGTHVFLQETNAPWHRLFHHCVEHGQRQDRALCRMI
jgi:hypothetical protein